MTEWRAVPKFSDYEVSDEGQIRRRVAVRGARAGRVLRSVPYENGYLRIGLYRDRKQITVAVSRVVCEAFHGPPPTSNHEAAHCDGDRHHNTATNVAWKTPEQNQEDRTRHGRDCFGEKNGNATLTENDVVVILGLPGSRSAIARRFGVSPTTISRIFLKQSWTHMQRRR